jgi:very-short-patch-repair endonuclease
MMWIVLSAVVLLCFAGALAVVVWRRRRRDRARLSGRWPYRRRRPLGDLEQSIFFSLMDALPDHIVLCQVSLAKLVFVRGQEARLWQRHVQDLVADFVVCDRSFRTVAVIELEDGFEDEIERTEAELRREKALMDAGFRLFRWNTFNLPSTDQMRNAIVGLKLAVDSPRSLQPLEPLEPPVQ